MKILNVNINGIKSKYEKIVEYINNNKYDIVNLQEVHLKRKETNIISKLEDDTKSFAFINSSHSQHGVITLIRNNILQFKTKQIESKENEFLNRFLHIQIETDEIINIINIYAPVNGQNYEKLYFYQKLKEHLSKFKNQIIILSGDFNYVTDKEDRENGFDYWDKRLNNIINFENLNLKDAFKTINPEVTNFTTKRSRIDRFLISNFLLTKIDLILHKEYISDHKAIELTLKFDKFQKWGRGYWKINNNYLNDKNFQKEIRETIRKVDFEHFNNPIKKWENIKGNIKKKSINYATFKAKERKNEEEIFENLLSQDINKEMKDKIEQKLDEIKKFKTEGIRIRIKNPTLKNIYQTGKILDRKEEIKNGNSKFINKINGKTNKDEILNETLNFYKTLYTKQNIKDEEIDNYLLNFNPNSITENEKENLNNFISNKEILDAIQQMNINKSPGEDGLTAEFYKTFKFELCDYLNELYNNILLMKIMPESISMGVITLIYKNKGNLDNLKNWRPITLLNLDYKILTKILTNRLKLLNTNIINNLQSSGLLNKSIINNALNIENLINYIEENDDEAIIISLDQEKAFDRVEHNYLFKVLEKFNFPDNFLNFIKIIYNDIKSKIQINGTFTETFKIERSVRQGCPLSMFLYVLSLEPFINKININKNIKGVKVPNFKEEIKTTQHADDTTVIIKNEISYHYLKKETEKFEKVSGSKNNKDKLQAIRIGKNKNKKLDSNLNNNIKESIKIYGIVYGKDSIRKNMEDLMNKIDKTLNKWKNVNADLFEKVIILKTYVISKIQFVQKIIEIPNEYIKKINTKIFKFLWNGIEKINRNTITNNTYKGGLALTDLGTSILTTHVQRFKNIIENKNQPWAQLYIYWFGLQLNFLVKDFSSNNYVHTIKIPLKLTKVQLNLIKARQIEKIWDISKTNIVYKILIDERKILPIIENKYNLCNWDVTWKCLNTVNNITNKNMLYKYFHKILPLGDYLNKIGVYKKIPVCFICKKGLYTHKHIFEFCEAIKTLRKKLSKDINKINGNIILNNTLIQTGTNNKEENIENKKICKLIMMYVLDTMEKVGGYITDGGHHE